MGTLELKMIEREYTLNIWKAGEIAREAAKRSGLDIISNSCRGPSTGLGYGNLITYYIQTKKQGFLSFPKLVARISRHEGLSGGEYFADEVRIEAPSIYYEQRVSPKLSSIAKIQDYDLRLFAANFYEVWEELRKTNKLKVRT